VELTVRVMQYDLEGVEGLVYGLSRAFGLYPKVPASPIAVSEEELRDIRQAAGPLGRTVTDSQEDLLLRALRAEKVRLARAKAEELCKILLQEALRERSGWAVDEIADRTGVPLFLILFPGAYP
jgi:hypothetical protein